MVLSNERINEFLEEINNSKHKESLKKLAEGEPSENTNTQNKKNDNI